ncbi:MAG: BCCT family transporter [Desulfopila sp.]
MTAEAQSKNRLDPGVFWPALLLIVAILIPCVLFPEAGRKWSGIVLNILTHSFDWFFEWFTLGCLLFAVWISLSRYGKIRLGLAHEKPEFSTASWLFLTITGCTSSSLMFWAILEPMYHYQSPPFGAAPQSAEAAGWAMAYGIMHWGPSVWSFFGLAGAAIGYFYYVRREPHLKASLTCEPVLGRYARKWPGKLIDFIVIVSLVGGVGTSLAVVVPMLAVWAEKLLGIQRSIGLDISIIFIWIAIFGTSAYLGLEKGMKVLSDVNVYAVIFIMAFMLLVGPTASLLSFATDSLGLLFQNFIRMSLFTDPVGGSGFPQNWTVFYWCWWVVYAIFLGIYIARISRGRTIRQVVLANTVFGSMGCAMFYIIMGGYTMHLEIAKVLPLTEIFSSQGPEYVIFAMFNTLPAKWLVWPLLVIVGFLGSATLFQGCALVMASICTKELPPGQEPAKWHRLLWALVLGLVGVVLRILGGLKALQLSAVIFGIPTVFVMVMVLYSFLQWAREDFKDQFAAEEFVLAKTPKND